VLHRAGGVGHQIDTKLGNASERTTQELRRNLNAEQRIQLNMLYITRLWIQLAILVLED
jgi:hypothetical protein